MFGDQHIQENDLPHIAQAKLAVINAQARLLSLSNHCSPDAAAALVRLSSGLEDAMYNDLPNYEKGRP